MLSLSHANVSKRFEVTTRSWDNLQILQNIVFGIFWQVLTEIIIFSLKIEMKRQYRWNNCQDLLFSALQDQVEVSNQTNWNWKTAHFLAQTNQT